MPRDESWLNVNQIARLVTLPRLPNVIVVLPRVRVGATFIFHLPHGAAFANTRDTYIALLGRARRFFFFSSISSCEEKLGALLSAFLRAPSGPCGGYRLVAFLPLGSNSAVRGRRLFFRRPHSLLPLRFFREGGERIGGIAGGRFDFSADRVLRTRLHTHTHLPRRLLVIRSAAAPSSLFSGSD